MASRKRIVICYILLQASFWGMISSICAYQAAIVLDRGFTTGQAGIFCALCYCASLFTQPVIGGWADRHPSVPIKRLLIVMLLPAMALNLVFYFTRPGFTLTALLAAERARRSLRLAGHGFAGFPVGGIIALADDLRIGRIFIVFGIPRSLRLFVREGGVILVVTDDGYRLSLFAAFACVSSYTARTPSAAGPSVPLPQTPRGSTGLR